MNAFDDILHQAERQFEIDQVEVGLRVARAQENETLFGLGPLLDEC